MILQLIFSLFFSMMLTWLLVYNKLGIKLMDHPNKRSLHTKPTPRSGGLAIATTLFIFLLINSSEIPDSIIDIAIGAFIVLSISVTDDIKHIPPPLRLFFHLLAAGWLVYSGFALESIVLPGGEEIVLSDSISWVITILGVTWMINLYNFMDGMDGFAGGMTVIGFSVFALIFFSSSQIMSTVSIFIVTATLGFLVFNFPPAKIFMGDSGSSLVGYLAAAMMLSADKNDIMPLWLAVILFSPFIVDATITLMIRIVRKQKIWVAHKQHFYQRLVGAGWSHRKTVLSEYCLMFICGILTIIGNNSRVIAQVLIVGLFIILYIAIVFIISATIKGRIDES